jgi:peptide/nickel transport system substrate-binding protein
VILGLVLVLAACAQPSGLDRSQETTAPVRARPKTLTVGLQRGLPDFSPFTAMSSSTSARAIPPMLSVGLTYTDDLNVVHPLKALELPSLENGTWRVFEDGRMETTWRLHPGVAWHDGTPQTPEDYLFAFEVSQDRDLPGSPTAADLAKSGLTFPDSHTMVISWSRPFVDVTIAGQDVLPRHRLEDAYRQDKQGAYINHPYWSYDYFAEGPYRIVRWDMGGDMELERFEQYFQGRPSFDRVYVRVIGDAQTLVANILSGAIDIVVPPGVDLDAALEVKRHWEGTNNVVRADVVGRIIHLEPQFRPEIARPSRGLTEQTVRQALHQAVNRQQLAEFMTYGFGPLADSYYQPDEPRRAQLAIP